MAVTSALCTSFKQELISGTHVFATSGGDVYKLALIKPSMAGTYGSASTNYSNITSNSDETTNAAGSAYTAGGATLTVSDVTSSGTTAWLSFSNVTWSSASFSCAGCMIYNSSKSNKAVAVFDFGGTQSCSGSTFQIIMPADTSSTAIVRIS